MHVSRPISVALAAAALALVVPESASAAPCGVFTADEGDNEIYYGLVAPKLNLPCPGDWRTRAAVIPEPTFRAAICWRDAGGDWRYEEVGTCNTSTPAADSLQIFGAGGDDVIMPVTHRGRNEEFICPVPGTSGSLLDYPRNRPPQWHSPPLYEWYERERTADPRFMGGCTESHDVLGLGLREPCGGQLRCRLQQPHLSRRRRQSRPDVWPSRVRHSARRRRHRPGCGF